MKLNFRKRRKKILFFIVGGVSPDEDYIGNRKLNFAVDVTVKWSISRVNDLRNEFFATFPLHFHPHLWEVQQKFVISSVKSQS